QQGQSAMIQHPSIARRLAMLGALAGALALAGCGSSPRQIFGFDRSTPDEFAAVTRAPLALPPQLGQLPPPYPAMHPPQEGLARERAVQALFGGPALAGAGTASAGAGATLLAQAGASQADPNIRRIVEQEADAEEIADRRFIDTLIFWQEQPPLGT